MQLQHNVSLKAYNTFRIKAIAKDFISVSSKEELMAVLKLYPNRKKLFLSGGSNMLLTTEEISDLVIQLNIKGKKILKQSSEVIEIEVMASEVMHDFILWCMDNDFGGMENLSLIPGHIGTAPIQNVGAYGVEIKDILKSCRALNIETLEIETFSTQDCAFGYRESFFKNEGKGKYVVLSVVLEFSLKNHKLHLDYGDIRKEIELLNISNPKIQDVSRAVISIRSKKLPDPKELGNSGSFFKNPIVGRKIFESFIKKFPLAPHYKLSDESYKIPAGWLIEQAGYKGFRKNDAGVHKNQALVLVNHNQATGKEILDLAKEIQHEILNKFGIEIQTEVNIIE